MPKRKYMFGYRFAWMMFFFFFVSGALQAQEYQLKTQTIIEQRSRFIRKPEVISLLRPFQIFHFVRRNEPLIPVQKNSYGDQNVEILRMLHDYDEYFLNPKRFSEQHRKYFSPKNYSLDIIDFYQSRVDLFRLLEIELNQQLDSAPDQVRSAIRDRSQSSQKALLKMLDQMRQMTSNEQLDLMALEITRKIRGVFIEWVAVCSFEGVVEYSVSPFDSQFLSKEIKQRFDELSKNTNEAKARLKMINLYPNIFKSRVIFDQGRVIRDPIEQARAFVRSKEFDLIQKIDDELRVIEIKEIPFVNYLDPDQSNKSKKTLLDQLKEHLEIIQFSKVKATRLKVFNVNGFSSQAQFSLKKELEIEPLPTSLDVLNRHCSQRMTRLAP